MNLAAVVIVTVNPVRNIKKEVIKRAAAAVRVAAVVSMMKMRYLAIKATVVMRLI